MKWWQWILEAIATMCMLALIPFVFLGAWIINLFGIGQGKSKMKWAWLLLLPSLVVAEVTIGFDSSVPVIVSQYEALGVQGPQPTATLYLVPQTSFYRLTLSLSAPTGNYGPGSILLNYSYQDGDTGQTTYVGTAGVPENGGAEAGGHILYAKKGSLIQLDTLFSVVTGSPTFNVHARLEQL